MKRKSVVTPVFIAPGLAVGTRRPETIMEAYKRLQRTCGHKQRDTNGTCYQCGHRMPREVFGD